MTNRDSGPTSRQAIGQPANVSEPPDPEPDFAEEHTSFTVADEPPGRTARTKEPESPDAAGGPGGMDV